MPWTLRAFGVIQSRRAAGWQAQGAGPSERRRPGQALTRREKDVVILESTRKRGCLFDERRLLAELLPDVHRQQRHLEIRDFLRQRERIRTGTVAHDGTLRGAPDTLDVSTAREAAGQAEEVVLEPFEVDVRERHAVVVAKRDKEIKMHGWSHGAKG